MKKQLHIVMLIHWDISYAESLMGILDAGLDNDGMEMNTLHAYYDEISGDVPMWYYHMLFQYTLCLVLPQLKLMFFKKIELWAK